MVLPIALIFLMALVAWIRGAGNIIDWTTFQFQITRETISHTFDVGTFEFAVPIESYLTFEYFNGTHVQPNTFYSYLFLAGIIISAIVLLSVITTLDRFWFITGMGLFILFMVSLRIDVLKLFGMNGRLIPISIIALFALVAFYFNTIRVTKPYIQRIATFGVLTLSTGILIYYFSSVQFPFLHLATAAYVPGLILTVILILMIAHEIMAGFMYITSSGTSSSKSLRHFVIITAIYLGNLLLAYGHEAGLLTWNFLYINLYLLFTVSIILGLWGFRHRENLYENLVPFQPYGAFFYLSMTLIAFSTLALLLGNDNDAALKVVRDFIIYSHIGYGFIFFIYVVSNFMVMMADNLPAWKVIYKPNRMPYFTFRLAGLIATMGFVFYTGWREYVYHGSAGFYYHLGDLYEQMDQRVIAEAYYLQARKYVGVNNRVNYIIARQEASRNDFKKAQGSYALANTRRPTEFSLANQSNLYLIGGSYFEGIESYRKALQEYPSNGILQNNLGYAYSRIHKLDSALILFDQSAGQSRSRAVAHSNFLALIGNEYLPVDVDSLVRQFKISSSFGKANALAAANQLRQNVSVDINLDEFKQLDHGTAVLLNNYLVYHLKELDSVTVSKALRIISDPVNADYSEALKATLAQAYYHQGDVTQALSLMSELAFLSQIMQGKFNYIAGLWALEQGCPELAIGYFEYAVMFDYKDARLYNAVALAEAGQLSRALMEADSLTKQPDENLQEIGRQLKKIILWPPREWANLNDLEKYQFCRYRITSRDTLLFNVIIPAITDNDLRVAALTDMSERLYDLMDMPGAIRYLNQTAGVPVRDKKLVERIQHHELIMLATRGELRALSQQINEGVTFPKERTLEKMLHQGLLLEMSGDTLAASTNFEQLGMRNPFFEAGVIASAEYFKRHSDDPMKSYRMLAEAIQVNTTSFRLWNAYRDAAARIGFDRQADDASVAMDEIRRRR